MFTVYIHLTYYLLEYRKRETVEKNEPGGSIALQPVFCMPAAIPAPAAVIRVQSQTLQRMWSSIIAASGS